jgi:hypothetical protein
MYMTQNDDKQPKRKSSRKSSRKKSKEEELDEEIEKKIEAAFRLNLVEAAKKKKASHKQMTNINSYIEEHLGCFLLLGYTIDGDPVTLVNAKTQKDSDSLGASIQRFMMKYQDPTPPAGPPII